MRILDPTFKDNIPRYTLQCLLAMAIIFIVMLFDDAVLSMTIVASLGASTFIAIAMPHTNSASPRYLVGGYIVGASCGVLMNFIYSYLVSMNIQILGHSPHILSCAIAVGLAMFLMVITNSEHPPAAALSMGLVSQPNALVTAFIAVSSIIIISVIKTLLKKWLKNLL